MLLMFISVDVDCKKNYCWLVITILVKPNRTTKVCSNLLMWVLANALKWCQLTQCLNKANQP